MFDLVLLLPTFPSQFWLVLLRIDIKFLFWPPRPLKQSRENLMYQITLTPLKIQSTTQYTDKK